MDLISYRCGTSSCGEITENADGTFTLTSTIPGNDGAVTWTAAETADFLADVKAGKLDEVHRRARQTATSVFA